MTILTIELPDNEVKEVSNYIKLKGGKVVDKTSTAEVRQSQLTSFEQGLREAIQISRGKIQGKPFSQLWDE